MGKFQLWNSLFWNKFNTFALGLNDSLPKRGNALKGETKRNVLSEFLKEVQNYTKQLMNGKNLKILWRSDSKFMVGATTYFNDTIVRNEILTTAEIAGHTIKWGNERHYLLANVALVGESIMLAMRTNFKVNQNNDGKD